MGKYSAHLSQSREKIMRISSDWSKRTRIWLFASIAWLFVHAAHAQPSADTTQTLPPELGGAISSATKGIGSALSNLMRSAPIQAPVNDAGSSESASMKAPAMRRSAANGADNEYEARQAKLRADEKARNNRAPVPITPDMCLDGLCVEQDLGEVAVNLNWTPPQGIEPPAFSYRTSLENCTQANQSQWAGKAEKLCEFLILGEWRPKADLVAFFKENRQAVCVTGGKFFKLQITTALGPTYAEVRFSKDGRPKIKELVKDFSIKNKDDIAEWSAQLRAKHPYLGNDTSGTAPWGGDVRYDDNRARLQQRYQLDARRGLFAGINGPTEGDCTPARKAISVQ